MNWRRIILVAFVLASTLGITTWALLQNSNAATIFVRNLAKDAFLTATAIESTSIDLSAGRLNIAGFELEDPNSPGKKLARVATANIDFQADPLGTGLALRHLVLDGVDIECGPVWPTISSLIAAQTDQKPANSELDIPVVEVRSGTASIRLIEGERPLVFRDISFKLVPLASDPSKLQLHGTMQLTQPACTVAVSGELDIRTGASRLSLQTENVDCNQRVVADLARLAQIELGDFDIGGKIESLSLGCSLPPSSSEGPSPSLQVVAQCSNVHLDAPDFPPIVRDASVTLFADTKATGEIRATVQQQNDTGSLSITTRIQGIQGLSETTFALRASGQNVAVNEDTIDALRSFPTGKRLVEALAPTTGRADIELYLENPHGSDPTTELDLSLKDGSLSYKGFGTPDNRIGFPIALENASGRVRLRKKILLLEEMQASIPQSAGGGDVTLVGRIEIDRPSGEDTSLDIQGENVAFSSELGSALGALLRDDGDLYQRLSPDGRASVHVVVRPRRELSGGFRVVIKPEGAAMRWAGFPYRLDDLRGSIRVDQNDAQFDLTGRHDDGGLNMRGRIPLRTGHEIINGFEAVIVADQLKLEEDLREGVATVVPELNEHWLKAAPTGRLSGEIKVWRPKPSDPLFHDVRLSLHDVDLLLPLAPWRATNLRGQVLVQGSGPQARIDFDSLRGQLEQEGDSIAQLALLGHLETGTNVVRDLAFVVRDLELDQQLGTSLDELGALDISTWKSLKPTGQVNLVCRERAGDAVGDNLQVVLQLVEVRSEAPMLPRPVEQMTGELHIENGKLTFRDVRGWLGPSEVRCTRGLVRQLPANDGRTEISFDVHAKNFPLDDGLANLFSGPLKRAVRERKIRGNADIDGLHLRFAIPTGDNKLPFSTSIGGDISLDGVEMMLGTGRDGIRIQNLHGEVSLTESFVNDKGGQLTGTLGRVSMSVFGHTFDAISAIFTTDAQRLTIDTLDSRFHDGRVKNGDAENPALTYLLPAANVPQGRLAADLAFDGVEVLPLLTTSGWENPPYSGSASGRITLSRLDGNKVVGAEASGKLKISRADLGKVPLFQAIYAQLPPADQPRFNRLDMEFHLTEQEMVFDQLDVRSDILEANGAGTLNLDGYLDVSMELDNLLGKSADPLVMPLIDYLAQNLVSFRLYGYLRDLHAKTELVGESTPSRRPVLPIPPTRPKPKTPGY